MTFRPRMENEINGFSVIGGPRYRAWNGIVVDLWDVDCAPGAGGHYVGRDPRIVFILEARGDTNRHVLMRDERRTARQLPDRQPISYVPPDMELWSEMRDVNFVRHLDLHFDVDIISKRLMQDLDSRVLTTPQLMFHDERLLGLARLIADECDNPDPLHDLYGDGLTIALLVDFFKIGKKKERKRSQLATWQLRTVVDYIEENCLRGIRLQELAELANLSQSHFSHAFKASTGMPPHQWQMKARMDRVKELLLKNGMPLTEIAVVTGFSDQAHFTRVFRKMFGVTPSAWQRTQR